MGEEADGATKGLLLVGCSLLIAGLLGMDSPKLGSCATLIGAGWSDGGKADEKRVSRGRHCDGARLLIEPFSLEIVE